MQYVNDKDYVVRQAQTNVDELPRLHKTARQIKSQDEAGQHHAGHNCIQCQPSSQCWGKLRRSTHLLGEVDRNEQECSEITENMDFEEGPETPRGTVPHNGIYRSEYGDIPSAHPG